MMPVPVAHALRLFNADGFESAKENDRECLPLPAFHSVFRIREKALHLEP